MTKPENLVFLINTVDIQQPSEFLNLGQMISETPFKLLRFTYKEKWDASAGEMVDMSELTIIHKDTGQTAVLIMTKVTNVADLL